MLGDINSGDDGGGGGGGDVGSGDDQQCLLSMNGVAVHG